MWVRSLGWEYSPGEEIGYPLQYFYLENPMDSGAWQDHKRVRHDLVTKEHYLEVLEIRIPGKVQLSWFSAPGFIRAKLKCRQGSIFLEYLKMNLFRSSFRLWDNSVLMWLWDWASCFIAGSSLVILSFLLCLSHTPSSIFKYSKGRLRLQISSLYYPPSAST